MRIKIVYFAQFYDFLKLMLLTDQAVSIRFDLEILWLKLFYTHSASIVALSLILFLVLHSQADRGWEHWKPHLASREESILCLSVATSGLFRSSTGRAKHVQSLIKEKLCHYVTNQSVKYTLPLPSTHLSLPFFSDSEDLP